MNLFQLHLITRKTIPQIFYRIILFFLITLLVFFLFKLNFKGFYKKNCTRKGIIFLDETWSEKIEISGDITILPFTKVTILPGTKILVHANKDTCQSGAGAILDEMTFNDPTATEKYAKTHTTFNIYGTLIAEGSLNKKIVFTSNASSPAHTDWDGILFSGRFSSGIVKHCIIEWTHFGLSIDKTENVTVSHNIIRHCFWGGIHAFRCSPIFEYNEIYDCGHEAFDTHEASPIIRHNIIRSCLVGSVFNNSNKKNPLIFEKNKIEDCSVLMVIQDTGWVVVKDNKFVSSDNLPRKFTYHDFTMPFDTTPMGIELCDNVSAEIYDNHFAGCKEYSISYKAVGPNKGISHTTHKPQEFQIKGIPRKIVIKNNIFEKTAPIRIRKKAKNVEIKNNKWIR